MKVALIHDHLAQDGGAEKVLKALAELFPNAPIYTLLYEKKHVNRYFKNRCIKTSIIQRLPFGIKYYQWYLPFMPIAVEFFDLTEYDLVISDASAFAKGVITSPHALHICYCHAPTRYLWDYTHKYITELQYNKYFKKIISLVLNYIRIWDRTAADRVDKYITNSKYVKEKIKKYYQHSSTVIYPPVEIDKFYISQNLFYNNQQENYFLVGARIVPYKRIDIVIQAFKILNSCKNSEKPYRTASVQRGKKFKLKIFGDGIDMERIKKIAGDDKNIEFLGYIVDDKIKAELYSNCLAFIYPQEEDFGITAVEAMASGRPVMAFNKGGAVETVVEGKTGIFFNKQTPEAIAETVKNFIPSDFNPQEIREHSKQFSKERFKKQILEFISKYQIRN
ncbi:glycosyltransferase [Patescibacteria group bacterium]|nr:glycosyltransferase [Patescibacteria group bacterium]